MRRTLVLLAGAAIAAAAPAQAAAKRVYVVSEARGFVHDSIPDAVAFFGRSPRYGVVHLRSGAAGLTARRLRSADAVVFANTSGELPLADRLALQRFVWEGGGFLGTHSAGDTLHAWPPYEGLVGGEFERHGASQRGRLVVEDRRHPVSRGLPRSFLLHEEFYEFVSPPRRRAHVLISLDPASIEGEQRRDLPLVWSRSHGRGRVFYDALGHFSATWRHSLHRRL
jgi:type 1 glutamine amidotransferase